MEDMKSVTKSKKEETKILKKHADDALNIINEHDEKILEIEKKRLLEREKWFSSHEETDIKGWLSISMRYAEMKTEITMQYSENKFLIKYWNKIVQGLNVRDKKDRFSKKFYDRPSTALIKYLSCRFEVPCKKCGRIFITRLGFVPKSLGKWSFPSLCHTCKNIKEEKRYCLGCGKEIPIGKRAHAATCGATCRKRISRINMRESISLQSP